MPQIPPNSPVTTIIFFTITTIFFFTPISSPPLISILILIPTPIVLSTPSPSPRIPFFIIIIIIISISISIPISMSFISIIFIIPVSSISSILSISVSFSVPIFTVYFSVSITTMFLFGFSFNLLLQLLNSIPIISNSQCLELPLRTTTVLLRTLDVTVPRTLLRRENSVDYREKCTDKLRSLWSSPPPWL
ncbi:hypothetical protein HN51_004658 [Arachis hypogaea]